MTATLPSDRVLFEIDRIHTAAARMRASEAPGAVKTRWLQERFLDAVRLNQSLRVAYEVEAKARLREWWKV